MLVGLGIVFDGFCHFLHKCIVYTLHVHILSSIPLRKSIVAACVQSCLSAYIEVTGDQGEQPPEDITPRAEDSTGPEPEAKGDVTGVLTSVANTRVFCSRFLLPTVLVIRVGRLRMFIAALSMRRIDHVRCCGTNTGYIHQTPPPSTPPPAPWRGSRPSCRCPRSKWTNQPYQKVALSLTPCINWAVITLSSLVVAVYIWSDGVIISSVDLATT